MKGRAMPAIATITIVGTAYLFVWALCRASGSAEDRARHLWEMEQRRQVRRSRREHPTGRPCLRLIQSCDLYDWQEEGTA